MNSQPGGIEVITGVCQIPALGLILWTYKVSLGGRVIVLDSWEIFGAGRRKVTQLVMTPLPPELRSRIYTPRNRRGRLGLLRVLPGLSLRST